MNQKHYLIRGTLLLTVMGLLTRAAGFLYKIFLSRTIGASQIGLYQLAFPVFSFCTALCGGGIQTAISKYVAERRAVSDRRGAKQILYGGLLLSVSLSLLSGVFLYLAASAIARRFLLEPSCTGLLKIMAFSLPFNAMHGCVCGYFMGAKHVVPPAVAQLAEQVIRIFFVVSVYMLSVNNGGQPGARLMVLGQAAGEAASALYCFCSLYQAEKKESADCPASGTSRSGKAGNTICSKNFTRKNMIPALQAWRRQLTPAIREIFSVSAPLSLNRMLMCVLQTIEAALLPQMLQRTGLSSGEALALYGTLTGMALPMILFPTAATSALGMLLLPAISEAQTLHHNKQLSATVGAAFQGGLLLGSFFLGAFLLFGEMVGSAVFHSELAGVYIRWLAPVCPLLYISGAMMSILHGLGKSASLLLWHLIGFALRFLCILRLVPVYGMRGYVCGMLLDQAFLTVCILYTLRQAETLDTGIPGTVVKMLLPAVSGVGAVLAFQSPTAQWLPVPAYLLAGGGIYLAVFLICTRMLLKPLPRNRSR